MDKKKKKLFSYIILVITILVLIIINLSTTFGYFVRNGEIITSSFDGHQSFNGNYYVNKIPFNNTVSDSTNVVIEGGNFKINESTITKSGNSTSNVLDGSNSAVLVQKDASLELFLGTVSTTATYSSGVYSNGGTIKIIGTTIQTHSDYSSGAVVSNNGVINADYAKFQMNGSYSYAFDILKSGGKVNVNGGSYVTTGDKSPVVMANGDIVINNNASLVSEKSEGFIVDGNHSVTFNNSKLSTNNTSLFDNTTSSKSIMLYQSSDKKMDSVTSFSANGSNLTTIVGDTFYVTNTKASIQLVNNTIVNHTGGLLRVEGSSFGQSGNNGGDVTLTMSNQTATGNVFVDDISKLDMNLSGGSHYSGAINHEHKNSDISLVISSDSSISLTADSYVTSFLDEDKTYSNIEFNGFDLYVNGEKLVVNTNGTSENGQSTGQGSGTSDSGDGQGSGQGNSTNQNENVKSEASSSDNQSSNPNVNSNSNEVANNQKSGSVTGNENGSGNGTGTVSSSNEGKTNAQENGSSNVEGNDNNVGVDISNNDADKYLGDLDTNATDGYTIYSNDDVGSIQGKDSKTLLIINVIGVLLIVTSIISLVRLHYDKNVLE